jgi:hypothetical protein
MSWSMRYDFYGYQYVFGVTLVSDIRNRNMSEQPANFQGTEVLRSLKNGASQSHHVISFASVETPFVSGALPSGYVPLANKLLSLRRQFS